MMIVIPDAARREMTPRAKARILRFAPFGAGADPGSVSKLARDPGSAQQRFTLQRIRDDGRKEERRGKFAERCLRVFREFPNDANIQFTDNTDKSATIRMRARFKPMPGAGTIRKIRTLFRAKGERRAGGAPD